MLNSNTLNWDQVKADFGDTNTAINTAIGGFSKAGDIFSKMRDRIATEQQQEWENQYKQNVFDESVRATNIADENADLDRDQAKLIAEWDKQVRDKANAISQQQANLANQQYYDTRADLLKVDEAIRDLTNGQRLYAQVKEHTPRFTELQQAAKSKKPLTEAEAKEYKALSDERTNFANLQMPETILSPTGSQQYLLSRLGSLYKLVPEVINTRATHEYNAKLTHDNEIKAKQTQGRAEVKAYADKFKESGSGGVIKTAYEVLLNNTEIDPLEISSILQQVEYNTGHFFDTDPDDAAEQVIDLFKAYGLEDKKLKILATQLNTSYTSDNKDNSSSSFSSSTSDNLAGGTGSLINKTANTDINAADINSKDLKDYFIKIKNDLLSNVESTSEAREMTLDSILGKNRLRLDNLKDITREDALKYLSTMLAKANSAMTPSENDIAFNAQGYDSFQPVEQGESLPFSLKEESTSFDYDPSFPPTSINRRIPPEARNYFMDRLLREINLAATSTDSSGVNEAALVDDLSHRLASIVDKGEPMGPEHMERLLKRLDSGRTESAIFNQLMEQIVKANANIPVGDINYTLPNTNGSLLPYLPSLKDILIPVEYRLGLDGNFGVPADYPPELLRREALLQKMLQNFK